MINLFYYLTGIKIEAGQDSTKNSKYSIDDILNQAEQSIEEYNYEMAQKFLERALEINSDHPRALEMTASLLLEVRNSFDFKIFGTLLVQKCRKKHPELMVESNGIGLKTRFGINFLVIP